MFFHSTCGLSSPEADFQIRANNVRWMVRLDAEFEATFLRGCWPGLAENLTARTFHGGPRKSPTSADDEKAEEIIVSNGN